MHHTYLSQSLTILGRADSITNSPTRFPLYMSPITAGRLAQAEAHVEDSLDLHAFCVRNPPATFFLRVEGDFMQDIGIHEGDLLIVDRSAEIYDGRVVIAALNGELTVKRLVRRNEFIRGKESVRIYLAPANPDFSEIDITNREYIYIWGVVTNVVHRVN